MATNDPTTTTTRRGLFGAAGAMLLLAAPAAGASGASETDAELIALCEAYCQGEADYARLCWSEDDLDDGHPDEDRAASPVEFRTLDEPQAIRANAIIVANPTSLEGLRAKARAAAAFWGGQYDPGGAGEAIMWAMVCDLTDDGSLSAGKTGA